MPDATPTSIEPPSPPRRNKLRTAAQWIVAAGVLFFIGRDFSRQWKLYSGEAMQIHLQWPWLVAAGGVVLITYALLTEVWRRILREWNATLSFGDAFRISSISKLGIYVPGRVWQMAVMSRLAYDKQVPVIPATGSAVLNTLVNIAVGFAVAVVAGYRGLDAMSGGHATIGIGLTVLAIGGVLLLPALLPTFATITRRLTGKEIDLGTLPIRAVYIAIAGNALAWVTYGWSFQFLVHAVLGRSPGTLADYIAAYAISYVIGYLAFFVPGGLGFREGALVKALTVLQLANIKEAAVIAIVSRLWLTVLEVTPGLLFLAAGTRTTTPRHGSNP